MPDTVIRLLESPEDMTLVEELQRAVWPGSETDVVPAHIFITAIGAFNEDELIGFVFGFPGIDFIPDGPRPKHCSHMMGIRPGQRDSGVGFALKRAQWQMVRKQGIDHITWTYDPLLSRNAYLNISKLGAVCNTYRRSEYGDMRDGLNAGLPSDRFQVDWWINTRRVERRLGKRARSSLKLENFSKAELHPIYTPQIGTSNLLQPPEHFAPLEGHLLLAEIPSNFGILKDADFALASRETGASFRAKFLKPHLLMDISLQILFTITKKVFTCLRTAKAPWNNNQ